MIRFLLVLVMLAGTAGAVVAYGDPDRIARASHKVSHIFRGQTASPAPAVQIPRGQGGEFALRAKINGVAAPMVIDTGATSVVLTWETAKAIGCRSRCSNTTSISKPPVVIPRQLASRWSASP